MPSPTAKVYLIVGTPYDEDGNPYCPVMSSIAGQTFFDPNDNIKYEDRIICVQEVKDFHQREKTPFGFYKYAEFNTINSPYLDDLDANDRLLHTLYMIVIDTYEVDGVEMYDYYTFLPREAGEYNPKTNSLYISIVEAYIPWITPIPEPSTALTALLGLAMLFRRGRRV